MTDTLKWEKIWFRKLPPLYKCLWIYMCDRCNFSGIWEVDFETAEYFIGEKIDIPLAQSLFEKQYEVINGGVRWYIKDFISFQYVNLTKNTIKSSIINELKKYGVSIPHVSPIGGVKSQRQDNSNSKEVVKEGEVKDIKHTYILVFEELWDKYPDKDGKKQAIIHFNASVKCEKDIKDIRSALDNYLQSKRVKEGFIKNGSTWFNNWRDWIPDTKFSNLTEQEKKYVTDVVNRRIKESVRL